MRSERVDWREKAEIWRNLTRPTASVELSDFAKPISRQRSMLGGEARIELRGLTLTFKPDERARRIAVLTSNINIGVKETNKTRSEADILLEVNHRLQRIRQIAQMSRDRAMLYFIDMAILHVGEMLPGQLNSDVQFDKSA